MKPRALLAAALLCMSTALLAQAPSVAIKGYDPVSYFTAGAPVKGESSIRYDFDDVRYHFKTPKNRELFVSNPDRYSPQFGGLCTAGLAMGQKAEADPSVWKIVDGKLYVFSSVGARNKMEQDPSMLAKARETYSKRN